jgi:hypothetical protein
MYAQMRRLRERNTQLLGNNSSKEAKMRFARYDSRINKASSSVNSNMMAAAARREHGNSVDIRKVDFMGDSGDRIFDTYRNRAFTPYERQTGYADAVRSALGSNG